MIPQEAMIPFLRHFHSVKSLLLYSAGPRILALDKFAFVSGFGFARPDITVKVCSD